MTTAHTWRDVRRTVTTYRVRVYAADWANGVHVGRRLAAS